MAVEVQVPGRCNIRVSIDDGANYNSLGFTQDGVELTFEPFTLDVPGDEHGGTDGPPIDVQFLGMIVRIRLQLTSWDTAVWKTIETRINDGVFGEVQQADIGALMFSHKYQLSIEPLPSRDLTNAADFDFEFERVIFKSGHEVNVGTKFATLVIEAEGHRDPSDPSQAAAQIFDQTKPA